MSPSKTTEEPKLTLPSGHPQAGYVSPDLSYSDGAGTLPAEEQEVIDERQEERDADAEAVAANEHKVATDEAKAKEAEVAATTTTAKASSTSETKAS